MVFMSHLLRLGPQSISFFLETFQVAPLVQGGQSGTNGINSTCVHIKIPLSDTKNIFTLLEYVSSMSDKYECHLTSQFCIKPMQLFFGKTNVVYMQKNGIKFGGWYEDVIMWELTEEHFILDSVQIGAGHASS